MASFSLLAICHSRLIFLHLHPIGSSFPRHRIFPFFQHIFDHFTYFYTSFVQFYLFFSIFSHLFYFIFLPVTFSVAFFDFFFSLSSFSASNELLSSLLPFPAWFLSYLPISPSIPLISLCFPSPFYSLTFAQFLPPLFLFSQTYFSALSSILSLLFRLQFHPSPVLLSLPSLTSNFHLVIFLPIFFFPPLVVRN